ncbi:uncharacterized protein [Montipora foliosa]|uniref:uncharacterized protein n=1 Tax=Montipora foliosa TaxID=591990 RepID=UPI0035F1FB9E
MMQLRFKCLRVLPTDIMRQSGLRKYQTKVQTDKCSPTSEEGAVALMLQVTRAHICEAFMAWAGMETLESRPLNLEIPPQSATVQEKHEFLEGCIANFVDKYALVVPDVKGLWEMEEAQRVESEQVSNQMQSQTNQNLYRPGTTVLLLKQSQELVTQCLLVAAGQIVDNESARTEKNSPN